MDFDEVAEELYAVSRDEFVATRDERVAQAKAGGERDLADRIRALRKPTVAAALLNAVARAHPTEVGELAELGESLRAAQRQLSGKDLRSLSKRRRELVSALAARAREHAGRQWGENAAQQVRDSLDAAVVDPDVAADLLGGKMQAAPQASATAGWDVATDLKAVPRKSGGRASAPARSSGSTEGKRGARPRTRSSADDGSARAVEEATAERQRATRDLRSAEDAEREAKAEVERLRFQLEQAKGAVREAVAATRAARRRLRAAEAEVASAERAADR